MVVDIASVAAPLNTSCVPTNGRGSVIAETRPTGPMSDASTSLAPTYTASSHQPCVTLCALRWVRHDSPDPSTTHRTGRQVNLRALEDLAHRWRADADVRRRRGAPTQADVLESCTAELVEELRSWGNKELTITEAASESGYSEDHLRDLVRSGRLPDNRAPGSEGRILVRRSDLPRKLPARSPTADTVHELAEALLQ